MPAACRVPRPASTQGAQEPHPQEHGGRYGKKPPVRKGGYYIWQFTEKGKIDGFCGTVDL